MTTATRLTCDWHEGCEAERQPYSNRVNEPEGWSHFTMTTYGNRDPNHPQRVLLEADLCPPHALAARELFGSPR